MGKKVLLIHPIVHDGLEYGRGVHEVSDTIAALWQKEAPHALAPVEATAVGKVVKAPDAPKAPEVPKDITHNLNVTEAIARIDSTTDVTVLKAMAASEKLHPGFDGGRKGVLDAIADRIEELKTK